MFVWGMVDRSEQITVFGAMRNEGPFIVEWVCWYRMLGFDVLIATNDCTDHSVALLDRLAEEGWLTHITHAPEERQPPKQSAHRVGLAHPQMQDADWAMVCDVDEFLVLHEGDGTIQSYLEGRDANVAGICFSWMCFGAGGWKRYHDGLVHRQFRRRGPESQRVNMPFKSLFKTPARYRRLNAHAPSGYDGDRSLPENRWIDGAGRPIQKFVDTDQPIHHLSPDQITHASAQMNHYVIRSEESFDIKRGKPSASALKDRYTDQFYRARNRNGFKDITAYKYAEGFDLIHAAAMALPGVARLHHLCCADYVVTLCAHKGVDHRTDERWIKHMDAASAG